MTGENWTLADLRRCNTERQAAWCPDQVPDLSFRGNELAGEVGEACNVIKKLERERHGWRGSRATGEQLAEELADVVICADLAALTAGVDLMSAVKAKFDATSDKVGLPHRLQGDHAQVYVVWSNEHRAWWGPNRAGYCTSLDQAGRYSREAALSICDGARGGRQYNDNPSEVPILLADAERFWPNDKPEWAAARFEYRQRLQSEER